MYVKHRRVRLKAGIVKAVCISEAKGTSKHDVGTAHAITGWGLENDAHGGDWHRQISLLSFESINEFNRQGAGVRFGDFGENIIAEGIDFKRLPAGTLLLCGKAELEITQIGKECHTHCNIYHKMGDCIMPREGVFARVVKDGVIFTGDKIEITGINKKFRAGVITLSDTAVTGEREDKSGAVAKSMLEEAGYIVEESIVLPDERKSLEDKLIDLSDRRQLDLIITTGGTGFSKRDNTPEATLSVAERIAPGISEAMRAHSLSITPRAMLSRGVSVIRGGTLIINLPGSPKAVRECLEYILPVLSHGIETLRGDTRECANFIDK